MTLAPAPLAIDGVLTSSSLLRKGLMASMGGTGVVGTNHLKVSASSPAGQSLQVAPGVAAVPNGYQSTPDEAYIVPNPSGHAVTSGDMPPASGSTTYWLVCLVVGDPSYDQTGHPYMPSDFDEEQLNTFQFNRIVLLPCTSTTSFFEELGKPYPGLALARIAIPPSTTTITDAMITDVRVKVGQLSPVNSQPLIGADRGNVVVQTNAFAQVAINFSKAFPSGYAPLVIATGGNDEHVYVLPTGGTNTYFIAQFRSASGVLLANSHIRCYWLAT